jgi:polyisoprenoid-binding protein YceI
MNKKIILLSLIASFALFSFKLSEGQTYDVLTTKSSLTWKAFKVGGMHEGTVALKSGSMVLDGDLITSGNFTIDMTTIKVTDTESAKLEKHLKSSEFFDAASFPEATLKILNSTLAGDLLKINADLTIRGITQKITIDAELLAKTENFISYKATIPVDRTKFGVTYRSTLGDAFIMDEFEMKAKITAERRK